MIKSDYHIHTSLCGHADGEPSEYAEQALKMGLTEIGFSDHAPLVALNDPSVSMQLDQLPRYHKMIADVIQAYKGKLNIKIGIEADFFPGYEDKTREILNAYPYDYVLGSVHYMEKWGFDDPIQRQIWDEKDVNEVYREYYQLLRASAQSKLFDIIAHVDLVKKFGHRPSQNLTDEVIKTASVFKDTGVAIEINTSGLRKPAKEIYPALWTLEIYAKAGVPIVFGSDSHSPDQVGKDFDKAAALAIKAGYKEYLIFEKRQIAIKEKLQ
ncbi:MAG: histidinol-phosphatase HisJ [Candidatus Omnitrophica bacterium]|nr:histidinol-phosphatase HisJ [Candidatus Omnitrophota bacterium]